jgi:hypothetical protein
MHPLPRCIFAYFLFIFVAVLPALRRPKSLCVTLFPALLLLDRVVALHSSCPAPSDFPPFAFASSSSPLSAATTPVLSRSSPLFQALQPQQQQHPPAHPTNHSPDPALFPNSSSSSFSSQHVSTSAARCPTPLSLLSNEFSAIMGTPLPPPPPPPPFPFLPSSLSATAHLRRTARPPPHPCAPVNPCPSPQPAASSHSPRGHPSATSSPASHLHSPSLLSRKRPAPLTAILPDRCPTESLAQQPLPCAVCHLAALPCTSLPLPRMIQALAAASLLVVRIP